MAMLDINLVRGIVLIALIVAFVSLWIWAWSRKRKAEFDEAARLPLEEDTGNVPQDEGKTTRTKE